MGSIRGWMQLGTKNKWLRWDPYQEWYDLWSVQESIDELASFFDRYLKDQKNDWDKTPRVRMASLTYGDKEAIYPIVEEDFPIPRTEYRTLYLGKDSDLSPTVPSETSIASYNAVSGTSPVASAQFTMKFDKPTRLMGLPKAVLYMSCPDFDDMVVYVLIRKLDSQGKPMININIPWSAAPYEKVADIPESDYSNLMIYYGPTGVLRASHRKIDALKSIHSQYPFHTHDKVEKVKPGEVVKLEIGIWAMGIDFEAGECLSVEVSGEYPLVNEFGTKKMEIEDRNRGTHQVHLGGDYASHVILPYV
jgi:predicted acyl esterase